MILKIAASVTLISVIAALVVSGGLAFLPAFHAKLWIAFVAIFLVMELLLLYGTFERRAPIFGRIFWRGASELREIAVTFDDGPNGPYTSKVLDILKDQEVRATFFVVGKNAERYPEVLARMAGEGHEIGNHTYTHEVLPLKSPAAVRTEILKTSAIIQNASGIRPALFRAPHGWRNPWVNRTVAGAGCTPVAWTLGVWDTDRPGAGVIAQRTLRGVESGCVLLLHDGRGLEEDADSSQLIEALPRILAELKQRGYHFVTVSRMLEQQNR